MLTGYFYLSRCLLLQPGVLFPPFLSNLLFRELPCLSFEHRNPLIER